MKTVVSVRNTRVSDIPQIIELQKRTYPGLGGWRREQLEAQLHAFPQGQLVACLEGEVVGTASSLIVKWDDFGALHTWRNATGGGLFTTHDPAGRTLYGAEVCTDPARRRLGIGKKLYQARRRLCRAMNLRRIMACGRLPHYHQYADRMTPEEYAMRVVWGDIVDPVLLFQMSQGFHYCGIVPGYLPSDEESRGNATIIVWLNERYRPDRPTNIAAEILL